jgi:hypothetical protein
MLTEADLIKVKTLTLKYAKQISIMQYTTDRSKPFQLILEEIRKDTLRPMGWVVADMLDDSPTWYPSASGKFWLVQWCGQLFWIPAPTDGTKVTAEMYILTLPQIFIG